MFSEFFVCLFFSSANFLAVLSRNSDNAGEFCFVVFLFFIIIQTLDLADAAIKRLAIKRRKAKHQVGPKSEFCNKRTF